MPSWRPRKGPGSLPIQDTLRSSITVSQAAPTWGLRCRAPQPPRGLRGQPRADLPRRSCGLPPPIWQSLRQQPIITKRPEKMRPRAIANWSTPAEEKKYPASERQRGSGKP
ncbi:uncharacterized protein LOC119171458 [Rhipicephalus microplus]|uniref:uncharacterized protein LOC119171458 n=1 Tax=Rhipicephalus microplus TaxID=6941 RepID=UPI003F6A8DDA